MLEATLLIQNQNGMHLRAARELVKVASRYRSRIVVAKDEVEVDAKSILGVLMLAAEPGAEIRVRADGEDEAEALAAIKSIVEGNFGEE